jgi:hypothetical protein
MEFNLKILEIIKLRHAAICILLFTSALAGEAAATTYYVSISGSDSNPGTQSQPFKTIQEAADTVKAGDTVIVKDGVYKEAISMRTSGTASNPVIFRSEKKWGAVIDGDSERIRRGIMLGSNSYIIIEDFEIRWQETNAINQGETSHITIRGNKIHHVGYGCGDVTMGAIDGDELDNLVIDSNIFYANGCPSDRRGHSIYSLGYDVLVINNIFYDHKSGWPRTYIN